MKKRLEGKSHILYRSIYVAAFFVGWHVLSVSLSTSFFPGPLPASEAFLRLLGSPDARQNFLITFSRVYESLIISMITGFGLGVAALYNKQAGYIVKTVVHPILQAVPDVSWSFIILVTLGLSHWSPIIIVSIVLIPYVMISVFEGFKELDEDLIELGNSFTEDKIRIFRKIHIPLLYPHLFSAFRRSHAVAWNVVLVAEIIAASNGIGRLLMIASNYYDIATVLGWTAVLVIIVAFFEYGVFEILDRKTMRSWRE